MRLAKSIGVGLLALGLSGGVAQAATVTVNDNFTMSGFGIGAPVDPVTGSFSVTFDNTADIIDGTGITATINTAVDGVFEFTYYASLDQLLVGGSANGASGVGSGTNDFLLTINTASTDPSALLFDYIAGGSAAFTATSLTNSFSTDVPEPASVLLFAMGCVGLAAARSRRAAG